MKSTSDVDFLIPVSHFRVIFFGLAPLYILMEATLGPNLMIHTIMVPESWIFLYILQSP